MNGLSVVHRTIRNSEKKIQRMHPRTSFSSMTAENTCCNSGGCFMGACVMWEDMTGEKWEMSEFVMSDGVMSDELKVRSE